MQLLDYSKAQHAAPLFYTIEYRYFEIWQTLSTAELEEVNMILEGVKS